MRPALWKDAQAETETVTKSHAGKYINLMVNYLFLPWFWLPPHLDTPGDAKRKMRGRIWTFLSHKGLYYPRACIATPVKSKLTQKLV